MVKLVLFSFVFKNLPGAKTLLTKFSFNIFLNEYAFVCIFALSVLYSCLFSHRMYFVAKCRNFRYEICICYFENSQFFQSQYYSKAVNHLFKLIYLQ